MSLTYLIDLGKNNSVGKYWIFYNDMMTVILQSVNHIRRDVV